VTAAQAPAPVDGPQLLGRLDRIPVWSLPWSYLVIIGIGYFFTFYDITDIGFAMPSIDKQFGLSGSESLFVALSIGLIGYIVGSLIIGTLADHFGRYRIFLLTIALTAVGSFGDAAANGLLVLTIFRFVTGMGVGADLNLVSTYIGELSPARLRGRISVMTFLIGILGQSVTPFVALALVPNFDSGWRWLFIIGGVIAAIGFLARFALPESPRWLVYHGRAEEARPLVESMEETARRRGAELPEPEPVELVQRERGFSMLQVLRAPYLGRLGIFIPMWFLWYIGNYGFLGDAATLYSDHGIPIGTSILYLAVGAVGYPVGAIIMIALVDRVERKVLIVGATVVWLVGMILISTLAGEAMLIVGSFLAALALGLYLQVAYTYTAESFPTRARSSGFALSDGIGHAGGALGALVLPTVVATFGFQVGFIGIGVTGLLAGILALLGPAASGRRLEAVSS
jgi:MFS family permease